MCKSCCGHCSAAQELSTKNRPADGSENAHAFLQPSSTLHTAHPIPSTGTGITPSRTCAVGPSQLAQCLIVSCFVPQNGCHNRIYCSFQWPDIGAVRIAESGISTVEIVGMVGTVEMVETVGTIRTIRMVGKGRRPKRRKKKKKQKTKKQKKKKKKKKQRSRIKRKKKGKKRKQFFLFT